MPPKKSKKVKKELTNPEQGLSKPAIMRILHRAGVKTASALVYAEFRDISMKFLKQVVRRSTLYTINRNKTTVHEKDVICSLDTLGYTYISPGGAGYPLNTSARLGFKVTKTKTNKRKTPKKDKLRSTHRFKSGTVSLRRIRRYQKSSELLLRKSPVKRIIRFHLDSIKIQSEYLNLDGSTFRLGSTATSALHTALEYHLVSVANRALFLALNSKRTRLQVTDVQIVADMMRN